MMQMIVFGGGRTSLNEDNEIEVLLRELFEARVRESDDFAAALWGSLANVVWHKGDLEVGYSFRAAGDVVACLRGEGSYMDWYCSAPDGVVSDEVADALAKRGWTYSLH